MTARTKKMTPTEFAATMRKIALDGLQNGDLESAHWDAEEQMGFVLEQLGYGEGVEVFRNMHKWYA